MKTAVQYLFFSVAIAGFAMLIPSGLDDLKDNTLWSGETFLYLGVAAVGTFVFVCTASKKLHKKQVGFAAFTGLGAMLVPAAILNWENPIHAAGISAFFAAGLFLHSFVNEPSSASDSTDNGGAAS